MASISSIDFVPKDLGFWHQFQPVEKSVLKLIKKIYYHLIHKHYSSLESHLESATQKKQIVLENRKFKEVRHEVNSFIEGGERRAYKGILKGKFGWKEVVYLEPCQREIAIPSLKRRKWECLFGPKTHFSADGLFLVRALAPFGDLHAVYDQLQDLPDEEKKRCQRVIVHNLLLAYLELRNNGVCHMDIKPGNILVCDKGKIRFIDFSGAEDQPQTIVPAIQGHFGTWTHQPYGVDCSMQKYDEYGLGVTLLMFFSQNLTNQWYLQGRVTEQQRRSWHQHLDAYINDAPQEYRLFITQLLNTQSNVTCKDIEKMIQSF